MGLCCSCEPHHVWEEAKRALLPDRATTRATTTTAMASLRLDPTCWCF